MTWHLEPSAVNRYVEDRLTPAHAASVESHVMACPDCRKLLAVAIDPARLAGNWAAVADQVDQPRRNVVERVLVRAGMRDHVARLIVLTPSLRLPWVVATAGLLLLSAASTREALGTGDRSVFAFLVLAPLLPLAGVGVSFGARTDRVHELTATSPISAIELLLVRALGVLATTTALTVVAGVMVPRQGWSAAVWLLPALGLTTSALALTRWCSAFASAVGVGSVWLAASSSVLIGTNARSQVVNQFVAFRPAGQVAFVALTVIAAACVVHERSSFDLRRIA